VGNRQVAVASCLRLVRGLFLAWLLLGGAGIARGQTRVDSVWREQRRVLSARPVIHSVQIQGQEHFSADLLKRRMQSKATSTFDFLPLVSARRLRRDSRVQDSIALYNWYRSQGFLNVDVELDYRFRGSARRSADVFVNLREGVQTTLTGYRLDYPPMPQAKDIEKAARRLKPDEPFNPFVLKQVEYDVRAVFANSGHPYARIQVDSLFSDQRRQVSLTLHLDPGPDVVFGQVTIPDLRWTRGKAVRRELVFKPGDLYRRRSILDSEQRLYSSGLFDYVTLESSTANAPGDTAPDFVVHGVERKPIFFSTRTGAKQDENQDLVWSLAGEAGDRNFTGTGRQIRASAEAEFIVITQWREQKYRFATALTEPWPFNLRVPATIELAWEPGVRNAIQPYRISRLEANLALFREWSRVTRTWLVFTYEQVDISGIDPAIEEQYRADAGITVSRTVTFTRQRDTRDSPLLPTRGSFTTTELEFAGAFLGGDNDFVRAEASWSRYYRIFPSRNIIAHRLKIGYLDGIGSEDRVPAQRLFFLGGANTVRGFKENSIGPKSADGIPLGGKLVLVANVELRRPLWGRLWGSAFVDAGNDWAELKDFRVDDWRVGAGAGLQFISPVGPLRVDYARRLVRDGIEPGSRVHVSILYAF
jgi:outer membrane protein insertion porin family